MKTKKLSAWETMQVFEACGVRFYDFGDYKEGKIKYTYYKMDKLTEDQRNCLLDNIPGVLFKISSPEYAPEIRRAMVMVPN